MRRAAQRDANEKPIVDALVAAGYLVKRLSGHGLPDLLVWSGVVIVLLEVKTPQRVNWHRKDRAAQDAFIALWAAAGAPVFKVSTVAEAMCAVGVAIDTKG
jgi:hypothetical protein